WASQSSSPQMQPHIKIPSDARCGRSRHGGAGQRIWMTVYRRPGAPIWSCLMRFRLSIALLSTTILQVAIANAQQSDAQAPCLAGRNAPVEQRLASCTEMIEAGHETPANLAAAYFNRGTIYLDKRDFDSAIVDFDQAITLDPKSSRSYNARGRAY